MRLRASGSRFRGLGNTACPEQAPAAATMIGIYGITPSTATIAVARTSVAINLHRRTDL